MRRRLSGTAAARKQKQSRAQGQNALKQKAAMVRLLNKWEKGK